MDPQLLSLLLFLGLLGVLIVVTELLHRRWGWPAEWSRKFLHVSGGLMCLLFPVFFHSHWWLLPLALISFLILLVSYCRNWLGSIHQTKRRSIGSVIFPIPVYGCFLLAQLMQDNLFFYIPISLLTISDTAAEMAGNRWGHKGRSFFNGQKTLVGALAFFITAIPVSFCWLYCNHRFDIPHALIYSILIAGIAAATELVTLNGWDNLSVPVVVSIMCWILLEI
jgi:phytol kinase